MWMDVVLLVIAVVPLVATNGTEIFDSVASFRSLHAQRIEET
jgi:hypothetical protein